jgi:Cold shock proteins
MTNGTVSWFDTNGGFGFITPDSGDPELFVDFTAIQGIELTLHKDQRVAFEITRGTMGLHATSVRLLTAV